MAIGGGGSFGFCALAARLSSSVSGATYCAPGYTVNANACCSSGCCAFSFLHPARASDATIATHSRRETLDMVRSVPSGKVFSGREIYHTLIMMPMRGRSLAPILALVILAIAIHVTALSGFFLYD